MSAADWFWILFAYAPLSGMVVFLLWATHDQGRTIRRQRRELRRLRGQQLDPDPMEVLAGALGRTPVQDPESGVTWLLPRQRTGGERS